MLNVVHLIDKMFAEINGKIYMTEQWGMPVDQILEYNRGNDVYVLETTLHSVHPRCIIVKRFHE
jgi:hypothetical protein